MQSKLDESLFLFISLEILLHIVEPTCMHYAGILLVFAAAASICHLCSFSIDGVVACASWAHAHKNLRSFNSIVVKQVKLELRTRGLRLCLARVGIRCRLRQLQFQELQGEQREQFQGQKLSLSGSWRNGYLTIQILVALWNDSLSFSYGLWCTSKLSVTGASNRKGKARTVLCGIEKDRKWSKRKRTSKVLNFWSELGKSFRHARVKPVIIYPSQRTL